jgi:hypothetical protein
MTHSPESHVMVSPPEVPQHEPPPLQVPVLSSQDSPEQTACAEGIHAAALSTSEALNKVLWMDVFIYATSLVALEL